MRRLFLALAIVGLAASQAVAGDYGTIELGNGAAPGSGFTRGPFQGNGGQFNWQFDDSGVAFPVGWSLDPSIDFAATPNTLASFCLELQQTVGEGTFDVNPLSKAPNGPAGFMTAAQASDLNKLATNFMLAVTTPTEAGAFQVAVWEILYGDYDTSTPINIGPGTGITDATTLADGQTLLNLLPGLQGVAGLKALALTNPLRQDMLVVVSVPEASSLLAFATVAGAIGLVMYRRRK